MSLIINFQVTLLGAVAFALSGGSGGSVRWSRPGAIGSPTVIILSVVPSTGPRALGVILDILMTSILIGLGAEFFVSFTFLLEPIKDFTFAFGALTFIAFGSRFVLSLFFAFILSLGVSVAFAFMSEVGVRHVIILHSLLNERLNAGEPLN